MILTLQHINRVAGVNLSFLPHAIVFFLYPSAPCASSPDQGTENLHRRRPAPRRRRRSSTLDTFIDDTAAASSLRDIAGRLDLPLCARRRSIAVGRASVSSSFVFVLPFPCFSVARPQ
jgi:hypothetical protein